LARRPLGQKYRLEPVLDQFLGLLHPARISPDFNSDHLGIGLQGLGLRRVVQPLVSWPYLRAW